MLAGDFLFSSSHHVNMEKAPQHDWYLHEWFATQGLKQNDLVKQLGYPKNTANRLWHGLQPYRRDHIDEIAALLNIAPHELLMPPEEAMRIRRVQSVLSEVASPAAPPTAVAEDLPAAGRRKAG
ncbi:transcriptional regulator with XRE-family HTH domain [Brevundimonas sp. UYEF29]|uniref:helix-turn-helix domain-containing protein n=1 Tax=Brevundimonas sp. UYEF29 TaxID=3156346 RepID=UPI003393DF23